MSFSSTSATIVALGDFDGMDDDALALAVGPLAEHARATAALQARSAAAVARLSDPSLGNAGLARRNGFVNAESFLQSQTGSTKAEAIKLVRVGELVDAPGWQGALGTAITTGDLSVDGANAIRVGLGGSGASESDLAAAARSLVDVAGTVDADELARRARHAREELDADSIARDEKARRAQRYFTARRRDDGVVTGSFALSDEDGAMLMAIYHQATSPKRIGPKFVDSGAASLPTESPLSADPRLADPRTRGQKAADVFAGLIRIGVETKDSAILGLSRPSVQIHVAAETIAKRAGHGFIQDVNDFPISFATVERHLCSSGVLGVGFDDDGQALNVGRDQRLFTKKQRIALAARDGGCRFPGCDRPVSWTEAHHAQYWQRDDGSTNIADGILLCRAHHQIIHDNEWVIRRDGGRYWLIPPQSIDPDQVPREMVSKNPLVRELQRANEHRAQAPVA